MSRTLQWGVSILSSSAFVIHSMKSKIPHVHHKTTRNDEKVIPSDVSVHDPIQVHDTLILLGAPHIEREEFNRMYHGPLATALTFISEHMKGRQGVSLGRHRIHQIRETRLKSHLKQPGDVTRPPTEKAASILSGAKKNTELLRRQMEDQQLEMEETQDILERLKRDLGVKQRTKLLLSVLEQKEKIRVKRFQEITRLITDLRKRVLEVKAQPSTSFSTESRDKIVQAFMSKIRPPRISHTLNALMNLHGHHLGLSRLIQLGSSSESEHLSHILGRIAQQAERFETDPNTVDRIIAIARARAKQRQRFKSHDFPPVSELELEKKYKANEERERELQKISDLAVALGFLCEHSISSANLFVEKSSPILRASLEEESPLAKGYIDTLRCIITSPPDEIPGETRFVQQVKSTCHLRGRITLSEIVACVEATIRKAHRQTLFLEALTIPPPSPLTEEQEALIASYSMNANNVQDRTTKLLTRKVEKAEMGYSLAKDVQNLIQEAKTIVG
ncbi:hypothetical protein BDZ94DRAFT_1306625 [Collybia nuda]|uniref:Uncharacterized protein n=1 Tax=Collybia nuda TaxID=64659 RepID=A0A9P6CH05_9AGAR|nr:hypothetical protein BDZ94DRAFT_1306625 [Collybia nuda]